MVEFFKELPVFVSDRFYEVIVDAKSDTSKLKLAFNHFPSSLHKDLFYHLLKVLWHVNFNSALNFVSAQQLAAVFAPCLVPKNFKGKLQETRIIGLETMIEQFELLFRVKKKKNNFDCLIDGKNWDLFFFRN